MEYASTIKYNHFKLCHYYLHFSDVPLIYRQTVKNYMKIRISKFKFYIHIKSLYD
ncbi:hypothetical protein CPJCM30710_10860 [Clostridium polyendosporum]|uniref:Uncharacterized protein n=1 Tax=Clostridium polyendosporum TaxID=69208 RepID=A0A919RZL8_9CLOT|nr:hypothetical protein CPJCM30710_10860 [Clostridium polyendosporum]